MARLLAAEENCLWRFSAPWVRKNKHYGARVKGIGAFLVKMIDILIDWLTDRTID